ncbi:MAG: hypothetical protein H0V70_21590 [Ktedonobacteraceae bacterium]|nr:hypothetical protein [Ktedonobacteraceae bacterium]
MSNMILRSIINSRAAHEPFIGAFETGTPFSGLSHSLQETQSSSVTPSGSLWLQTLARLVYEPPRAVSRSEIENKELPQSTAQSQKNHALIQLLRSWREGDEQEQRSTWEYLKQALDEDRLSERKLFP